MQRLLCTYYHSLMPALAPTPTLRLLSLFFPTVTNTSLKTSFTKWMDSKAKSHAYVPRFLKSIFDELVTRRSNPLVPPTHLHPRPRSQRRYQGPDHSARQISSLQTLTTSILSQREMQPGSRSNNGNVLRTNYESPSRKRLLLNRRSGLLRQV